MTTVTGVRFKPNGKIYYFDPKDHHLEDGDEVIVETARGTEFGTVVISPRDVDDDEIVAPLKAVERKATWEDKKHQDDNKLRAAHAMEICKGKVEEHGLGMHLIDSEYTFDNSKLLFYFTADGRVDFRELVKDLAAIFRTRIELRQVGVRDEAKIIGGMGCCGRETCCTTCLSEFSPVHIKMAKDQSLSLNPNKISGLCGRLMCCLRYEQEHYEEIIDYLPDLGEVVSTPLGKGPVMSLQTLKEIVSVRLRDENGEFELKEFNFKDIKKTGKYNRNYAQKANRDDEGVNESELKNLEKN